VADDEEQDSELTIPHARKEEAVLVSSVGETGEENTKFC